MPTNFYEKLKTLIRDVEEGVEQLKYHVALSKLIIYVKELEAYEGKIDAEIWKVYIKLLAPFAPFITEEIWNRMGEKGSVHFQEWPNKVIG